MAFLDPFKPPEHVPLYVTYVTQRYWKHGMFTYDFCKALMIRLIQAEDPLTQKKWLVPDGF
ncbi:hypothetical protein L0F63_006130, partial [Massospora cicadina]